MSEKAAHEALARDHAQRCADEHEKMLGLLADLREVSTSQKEHIERLTTNNTALAEVSKEIGENNKQLIKQTARKQNGVPISVFFIVVGTICLGALIAIVSLTHVNLVVESNSVKIITSEENKKAIPADAKPNLKLGNFNVSVTAKQHERI